LLRIANETKSSDERPELTQVNTVDRDSYRMHRKLNPTQQAELIALYEAGSSMLDLSKKFETHRHTVARQLAKAGVEIRSQRKMTPKLLAQATSLYGSSHSLEEVGLLLGLQASTIGKALKRAGFTLRPPVADRWRTKTD
jgi:DNA-directed RNA polymerase specialized sigma24 family protein